MNLSKQHSNIIGVDIDGVISDIAGHLVQYAKSMYGCMITVEGITSENVETCSDLSADDVRGIFSTPLFFQSIPALPTAKDALNQLVRTGWKVVLMTDRFWYPEIQEDTLSWLKENNIPFHSILYVNKTEKAVWSGKMGIKYFIEDQLSNANLLSEVCNDVFLIDRPYNKGVTLPGVCRVSDICEAVYLLNVSKGKGLQDEPIS